MLDLQAGRPEERHASVHDQRLADTGVLPRKPVGSEVIKTVLDWASYVGGLIACSLLIGVLVGAWVTGGTEKEDA